MKKFITSGPTFDTRPLLLVENVVIGKNKLQCNLSETAIKK